MKRQKTYDDVLGYVRMIAERNEWKLIEDEDMLRTLVAGLMTNFNRLGYYNCPCRDNHGDARLDSDIICPCVYARTSDIPEYGTCFCALFFRKDFDMSQRFSQIPDRRPPDKAR
jgi:ferredoxin-thioredoxin reductase catalytic subunit